MKVLFFLATLLLSLPTFSTVDLASLESTAPTAKELKTSRSCFGELETLGCGHPRDDQERFESCLHNVYSSLTTSCRQMMGELYGVRK
jgi:hypothetical protein